MCNSKLELKRCVITDADRSRLGSLLESNEGRSWGPARIRRILDARLEDSIPVSSNKTPESLVTMNSIVELVDMGTGERCEVTLAYPADCVFMPKGISVLEPLGMKLLGCEVGGVIHDNGRRFRVAKIVYQPEAAGALHL